MDQPWMIYGAYGYSGRLIAQEAAARGMRPTLAGRRREPLEAVARDLGLAWRAFDLADGDAIDQALQGHRLVLHCAGPFVHTSAPMVEACLRTGVHYLDITGEIAVFEAIFARGEEARARRVALLPGVGFDVVPSDCLARHVAERCPGARSLELFIDAGTSMSAGTTRSMLEALPAGGLVRRGGRLVPHPLGTGVRTAPFLHGEKQVIPIPWGDLSTAWRSTGIPDITTYMVAPTGAPTALRLLGPILHKAMEAAPIRDAIGRLAGDLARPPDAEARRAGRSEIHARAEGGGRYAEAWLELPEPYRFTALSALRVVERVLAAEPAGALPPAQAFGADLVLEIPGVRRHDEHPGRSA